MKKILLSLVLIIFVFSCVYAQQVSNNIRSLLSSEGRIMYGEEPNSLVVTDYPENLQRIAEYLNVVDTAPQQVLIEAKVVEVRLGKEHALGVNWQMFAAKGGLEVGQFKVSSSLAGGPLEQQIPYKPTYYPPGQTAETAEENPFTFTIFDDNLNIVLEALANDLETNILSAPSVTTVNNREAQIRIVQRVPWAEPTVELTEWGSSITWTIHFEDVGITLKVTPTINDDGKITMNLLPEVSEQVDEMELEVVSGGNNSQNVTYTVPVIDRRSASTKVVVGTGQTLIIGGLIKNKSTKGHTKVPFLGDMPILGHFFKSSRDTLEKIELLIFVSPTIVNTNEVARMVRQEKFGLGRESYLQHQRLEKMALILENQERQKREKVSLDWEMLSKKNAELSEQTRKLEQMLLMEEKNVQALEEAKQTAIQRRQALTK